MHFQIIIIKLTEKKMEEDEEDEEEEKGEEEEEEEKEEKKKSTSQICLPGHCNVTQRKNSKTDTNYDFYYEPMCIIETQVAEVKQGTVMTGTVSSNFAIPLKANSQEEKSLGKEEYR